METKNGASVPPMLGMALLGNPRAYIRFAQMTDEAQRAVVNGTKRIRTRQELEVYVSRLCD